MIRLGKRSLRGEQSCRTGPSLQWYELLLALSALATPSYVLAAAGLFAGITRIDNLLAPVYLSFGSKPVALLRVEHVYHDYQRVGFFRIGAFPLVVLEKVKLEIRDPAKLLAALTQVEGQLGWGDGSGDAVEGRDFTLIGTSQNGVRVKARILRFESGASWRLLDGSVDLPGSAPITFQRATLVIRGLRAGRLTCQMASGVVRLNLLMLFGNSPPKP